MLQNCLPQNVQRVLRELPKSLDETYERVLKGIGTANRRQAHRLLQCLTVATRPLYVEELAEVLALDFDGAKDGIPTLNKDWRWDDRQQGVLSTCSSLIIVTDGVYNFNLSSRRVVQFAHFSVEEFLTSDRLSDLKADISHFHISLEPAHTLMAQACLGISLQPDKNSDDNGKVKDSSPLAGYAAQHWVAHAQFENVSSCVEVGMRHLFDPKNPYFAAWLKSYNIDKEWSSFRRDDRSVPPDSEPPQLHEDHASLCLYYASFCGFRNMTKHLISKTPQHVNTRVGLNRSPLVAALRNRHIQVAEVLRQHGAVLDIIGHQNRTLLHAAARDGLTDVAQWLLNIGADANAQQDDHMTPLHLAAAKGHRELVRILLEHCVDVNAVARGDRTPLHEASAGGHVDIVQLLIQHGADANKDLSGLLLLASSSPSAETVQFFIQLGADVNTRDECHSWDGSHWLDGSHPMPLHRALSSFMWNPEIVQLLVENGADIHAQNGSPTHSTPLHLAVSRRRGKETMKLLIKHGADVNAQDSGHSTPLHLVSSSSCGDAADAEIVQLLIHHGADVRAQDLSHSTPLHRAVWMPDVKTETLQLLIKHGADVNAQDQKHSTPLHEAFAQGPTENLQLLIENGADVHAQDERLRTPLHLASLRGMVKIMLLLIEHGADVNPQDKEHTTPLHLASTSTRSRDTQIAPLLLIQHGANVHAQDQNHWTPLHMASSLGGSPEVVQLLLQHGADVQAQDQHLMTPLHVASFWRTSKIVRVLIEHGADVHARNQSLSTPLHLAAPYEAELIRILIENGADVNARDWYGSMPLHLALSSSWNTESVRLLIEHGSEVNAYNGSHSTPLHLAISRQDPDVVRLLLEHGANVDLEDDKGQTPFQILSSPLFPGNYDGIMMCYNTQTAPDYMPLVGLPETLTY
jgi:ankyrin repeat protein